MPAMTQAPAGEREKDADGASAAGGYASGAPEGQALRYAADRTFVWRDGAWIDTLYSADDMEPITVTFLSDAYFDLLELDPRVGEYLALGDHVLFVWDGQAYEVVPD